MTDSLAALFRVFERQERRRPGGEKERLYRAMLREARREGER